MYRRNAADFQRGRSRSVSIKALSDYSGMEDELDESRETPPQREVDWFEFNELFDRMSE